MDRYQLMPALSKDEYTKLRDDISKRGVMVPIEYDELGNVLDGHHRIRICQELGITDWPRFIRKGLTEDEKKSHAIALNLARRHLSNEQRRPFWEQMRQAGMTLEAIAKADGTVSPKTVQRALDAVLSNDKTDKVTGKDGKKYPTKKKPRKKKTCYISEEAAKKAEKLPEKHKQAVLLGEKSPTEASRDAKIENLSKKQVDLSGTKYRVVYADPPWSYGNTQPDYHTEQRDHYQVMDLKSICGLPIKEICEQDSVLFIWVTSPILEESFQVINSWGFKYKASFVWDKVKHNMGHYNSVRHEFLLICVRGSCQPDIRKLFDSVVTEERTKHSKKPEIFYDIIDTLYPNGKRIELFARSKRNGWDSYGNEV